MGLLSLEHLAGGLSGGFVSTVIVHPLDLLKVRFAANEGARSGRPQHGGYAATARAIVRSAGLRGLYQGLAPNLVGNTLSWGLYFHLFNSLKGWMRRSEDEALPAHFHLFAGVLSGVGTLSLTNPIWVAKTRLCLQYEGQDRRYRGLSDVLLRMLREDGIRGWYKGFVPGLLGTSHGALQFMTYEELRKLHHRLTAVPLSEKLGALDYMFMAAISKLVAVIITYPYQVVRTRLQDQHVSHGGVGAVVRATWAGEGVRGFYKGLPPSLLRVVPATAVTFLVYESVSHAVRDANARRAL